MSLVLSSPHQKCDAIDALKLCLSLFMLHHTVGGNRDQLIAHIAQMDLWPHGLEVAAKFETFPLRRRTILTLTFDQMDPIGKGKLNG